MRTHAAVKEHRSRSMLYHTINIPNEHRHIGREWRADQRETCDSSFNRSVVLYLVDNRPPRSRGMLKKRLVSIHTFLKGLNVFLSRKR